MHDQSYENVCDPMDCSPPGSIYGIFQARILGGLPFPPSGDLPNPGIEPSSLTSPALAGRFFTTSATWEEKVWSIYKMKEYEIIKKNIASRNFYQVIVIKFCYKKEAK